MATAAEIKAEIEILNALYADRWRGGVRRRGKQGPPWTTPGWNRNQTAYAHQYNKLLDLTGSKGAYLSWTDIPFEPADILGLRWVIDPAHGVSLDDDGKIVSLTDQSSGLIVAQSDASKRFVFEPTGFNGKPCIENSNPFAFLFNDTENLLPVGSPMTVFTVAQAHTGSHGFFLGLSLGDLCKCIGIWNHDDIIYSYSNLLVVSEPSDLVQSDLEAPHVYCHRYTGSGRMELSVDGSPRVISGSDVQDESGATGFVFGSNGYGGFGAHDAFGGRIAAQYVFDHVLSSDNEADMTAWLAGKFI